VISVFRFWYLQTEMRKTQLASRLARRSGVTRAEAADQLDHVVHKIISNLRSGKPAALLGLGHFEPGETWRFRFDPQSEKDPNDQGK